MDLNGTVSLVTGAAHRLGRAVALELAAAGSDVVVHFHDSREAALRTAADIQALGVRAEAVPADLGQPEAIDALFGQIDRAFGRLDVVVNSAALFERRAFDEISVADWDRALAVNLRAPFLVLQQAQRRMRSTPRRAPALAVNVADLSGVQVWHDYVQHGVSKAGLMHLTRIAARELAPDVRVNAVVPGAVLPPHGTSAESESWLSFGRKLPLGTVGEPAQVAHAVRFLAENDFVTGTVLFVDGGEHLGGPRRH